MNISKFEKDLKLKFKNKSLIIQALTHKSYNQHNNNEKLEFLGDRVIGLVLSKKLFDHKCIEFDAINKYLVMKILSSTQYAIIC